MGLHKGSERYMGGCQNCHPFLGTLNIRCHFKTRIQKGTIILTTTHMITIELEANDRAASDSTWT